jgi:hypothetical protein
MTLDPTDISTTYGFRNTKASLYFLSPTQESQDDQAAISQFQLLVVCIHLPASTRNLLVITSGVCVLFLRLNNALEAPPRISRLLFKKRGI